MENRTTAAAQILATHFVSPAWWVRAYEAATLREATASGVGEHSGYGLSQSAMAEACTAGITPVLSAAELSALAPLLANLQTQVFGTTFSESGYLSIRADEHRKHATTAAPNRRFAFENSAQLLTSLRLLQAAAGAGSWTTWSLFESERWRRVEGSTDRDISVKARARPGQRFANVVPPAATLNRHTFEMQLVPAALGCELIFGLGDAHMDLARALNGEAEASRLLGDTRRQISKYNAAGRIG